MARMDTDGREEEEVLGWINRVRKKRGGSRNGATDAESKKERKRRGLRRGAANSYDAALMSLHS